MKDTQQKDRSFVWYNATQFLGAFNDSVFKLLVILFVIGLRGREYATEISALAGAIIVVPFLLFSAYAGRLADRYSKRSIIVALKFAELVIMIFGLIAFWLENVAALYAVLFLMSAQSAFFGPCKYGIIREIVTDDRLSWANGIVQSLTYISIISGTATGPFLVGLLQGRYIPAAVFCVVVAAAGFICSVHIKETRRAGGKSRASILFVRDIWRTLYSIKDDRALLLAAIGAAYFSFLGAFVYLNIIPYGLSSLSLTKEQSGYLFVVAAIGISAGSYIAGRLSGRGITLGAIPLGAAGMAGCSLVLGLTGADLYPAASLIALLGMFAGLYVVPVNAYVQMKSPAERRAEVIAASNFIGWCGILAASGFIYLYDHWLGVTPAGVFIIFTGKALLAAVIAGLVLSGDMLRLIGSLLVRLFYKVEVYGLENIPAKGGAIIACNHSSYIDPLIIQAAQDRALSFVVHRYFYNKWWLKPFCRLTDSIPIAKSDRPGRLLNSIRRAAELVEQGRVLCIFPEAGMTRNGNLRSFKNGYELIVRQSNSMVIPAYIGGMWKSMFSYYYGRPFSRLPRRFRPRISVHFGQALSGDVSVHKLREKITELSCDYFNSLKSAERNLGYRFVKSARRCWYRRCISDTGGRELSYSRTLTSAVLLAGRIEKMAADEKMVGLILPPCVAAVLSNVAVTLSGKVPVNLNYLLDTDRIEAMARRCSIEHIISSRQFLDKQPRLKKLRNIIFLEDILDTISPLEKLSAYIKARFAPARWFNIFGPDDIATIVFSSGSDGRAKAVMLSHHNIISNIEAMLSVFRLKKDDNLCGTLPLFHSFGLTCSLWLVLLAGASAAYVPNPLDIDAVGSLARKNRSTILFATPTFLSHYARRIEPSDFANLRLVITGAEKLRAGLADLFEAKFGLRPYEGYGATELSPVVSLNLPQDEICLKVGQICAKEGTVGQPIPGCAIKIVHPETHIELPAGGEGLVMVKGPNVMLGYMDDAQKTSEVIKDGWYLTGDIGRLDEDGFLIIADRLSRFAKIAGEMVPLVALEEFFHKKLGTAEQLVAVTCIPDNRGTEQLVVLYSRQAGPADRLYKMISESDFPNLWKPKRDNFIELEHLPVLPSGKLDITRIKRIALEAKGIICEEDGQNWQ